MTKSAAVKFWASFLLVFTSFLAGAQPDKMYTSLTEALQNPEQVYKLALRKNKLKELPAEIRLFKNLTYLDVSKNRLNDLPAWFAELVLVEELYLTVNKFTQLPQPVFALAKLRVLVVDRNPVNHIAADIQQLTQLELLNLWDTEIESLPETISALKNLKRLDVRNTLIYKNELEKYQSLLPNTEIQVTNGCDCKK